MGDEDGNVASWVMLLELPVNSVEKRSELKITIITIIQIRS